MLYLKKPNSPLVAFVFLQQLFTLVGSLLSCTVIDYYSKVIAFTIYFTKERKYCILDEEMLPIITQTKM